MLRSVTSVMNSRLMHQVCVPLCLDLCLVHFALPVRRQLVVVLIFLCCQPVVGIFFDFLSDVSLGLCERFQLNTMEGGDSHSTSSASSSGTHTPSCVNAMCILCGPQHVDALHSVRSSCATTGVPPPPSTVPPAPYATSPVGAKKKDKSLQERLDSLKQHCSDLEQKISVNDGRR
jgi:hypothetical protein